MNNGVTELAPTVGIKAACGHLGRSRATHYRQNQPPLHGPPRPRPRSPRALPASEITEIVGVLKTVTQPLADLGILQSHSRPHVSNDNPFSESQFKTLKQSPRFPKRFANLTAARRFVDEFMGHYNHQHRHSGIGYHTPADVHTGQAAAIQQARQQVLDTAYQQHPERFTKPPQIPHTTWINKPEETTTI